MSNGRLRLAVDIGGTFVDATELDSVTGEFRFEKAPATPANPSDGVVAAMAALGTHLTELDYFIHGTTLGLNAVLERAGARVGIITNAGFRDIFLIGRANVPDAHMYNFTYARPQPLVRRHRIEGVRCRLNYRGEVVDELVESEVVEAARRLVENHGVEAIAICFLFSYLNPDHERRTAGLIHREYPDMRVSFSSEITREHREYERTSTAVLDAYIRPIFERYIDELQEHLDAQSFRGQFLVTRSGGGAMTATAARRSPTNTIVSGPAGGITGAAFLASALGRKDLISFDVGGTSLDVCLIENGRAAPAFEAMLENHPILIPIYDIHTIGAGGGSIAWMDEGLLNVGPQSAGAEPGPICYRRGGTRPTVTDACLLLGYIEPKSFLGGNMPLDAAAAHDGIRDSIAREMGLGVTRASAGVLDVLMAKTVGAVRRITVERGRDPRDSALLAFGGAGPLLGSMVAAEMGLREVIVPNAPSAFSAWGMLSADVVDDFSRTRIALLDDIGPELLESIFREIEREALGSLQEQEFSKSGAVLLRQLELRYLGQEHTLPVEVAAPIEPEAIRVRFGELHEARYGHRMEAAVQIVNIRIRATGKISKPPLPERSVRAPGERAAGAGIRSAYCYTTRAMTEFDLYWRDSLAPGDEIPGPALVEEATSVTVVHCGQQLNVDPYGHLIVATGKRDDTHET